MIDPSMIIRDEGYSHGGLETASIHDLVPENCLDPEDSLRAVYKCPAIFYVWFAPRRGNRRIEARNRITRFAARFPRPCEGYTEEYIDRSPVERPSGSPARGIKAVEEDEEEVWAPMRYRRA